MLGSYPMSIPPTMKVMEIVGKGPAGDFCPATRPVPAPGPDQILIRVAYAGINRADVLQRLGKYDPPPGMTDIPGLEVSGQVVTLGPNVTSWKVGQNVCALLAGGGYAEYVIAPVVQCLPLPRGKTWNQLLHCQKPL